MRYYSVDSYSHDYNYNRDNEADGFTALGWIIFGLVIWCLWCRCRRGCKKKAKNERRRQMTMNHDNEQNDDDNNNYNNEYQYDGTNNVTNTDCGMSSSVPFATAIPLPPQSPPSRRVSMEGTVIVADIEDSRRTSATEGSNDNTVGSSITAPRRRPYDHHRDDHHRHHPAAPRAATTKQPRGGTRRASKRKEIQRRRPLSPSPPPPIIKDIRNGERERENIITAVVYKDTPDEDLGITLLRYRHRQTGDVDDDDGDGGKISFFIRSMTADSPFRRQTKLRTGMEVISINDLDLVAPRTNNDNKSATTDSRHHHHHHPPPTLNDAMDILHDAVGEVVIMAIDKTPVRMTAIRRK